MSQLILILHLLACLAIIALVLLQHGKGADMGAAFGSGASNTMFGSVGAMPFLMKLTAILAMVFFTTSIVLSYLTTHGTRANSIYTIPASMQTQSVPKTQNNGVKAVPATATPPQNK